MWRCLLVLVLLGCDTRATTPNPDVDICRVVKFEASGEEPACAIRCAWNEGSGNFKTGYSDTTPVSCSWYGKTVSFR